MRLQTIATSRSISSGPVIIFSARTTAMADLNASCARTPMGLEDPNDLLEDLDQALRATIHTV